MLLWIVCGVLTVGVILALTAPLARKPQPETAPHGDGPSDIDVYRDQLREVDQARGRVVGEQEHAGLHGAMGSDHHATVFERSRNRP